MYCGDETGAFIGEIASHTSRFGYGGEDCPKAVLNSYMYTDGTIPITTHKPPNRQTENDIISIYSLFPSISLSHPLTTKCCNADLFRDNDGIIQSFDAWENSWQKAFDQLAVRKYSKHSCGTKHVPKKRSTGVDSSYVESTLVDTVPQLMHPLLAIDAGYTNYGDGTTHYESFQNHHDNNNTTNNTTTSLGNQFRNAIGRKQRNTMTEILFESLSAPAAFIAPTPMLVSFAHGRQTSLVVDIGAMGTRVTPIVDGLLLQNSQRRTGRGGEWLNFIQGCALQLGGVDIVPRHISSLKNKKKYSSIPSSTINSSSITPESTDGSSDKEEETLFHRLAVRDIMYEMKTSPHVTVPFVYSNDTSPFNYDMQLFTKDSSSFTWDARYKSSDIDDDADDAENNSIKYYELPDGTRIDISNSNYGKALCQLPESFFTRDPLFSTNSQSSSNTNDVLPTKVVGETLSDLPIHELTKASLTAVSDCDVRKELCGNIILTGASSLFPNMEQRLSLELSTMLPSTHRCKVIASRNTVERRYSAYIGGSIFTSLGSFQQLWLSKAEYDEYGVTLSTQRFP